MDRPIVIDASASRKLRVIALVSLWFVVLQHACYVMPVIWFRDLVSLGIADFPVPYFMIVSGFFLMKRYQPTVSWYRGEIWKRVKSLLVPLVIWTLIAKLLLRDFEFSNILSELGVTSICTYVGTFWYVRTLFVLCLLSPVSIGIVCLTAKFRWVRYLVLLAVVGSFFVRVPLASSFVYPFYYFTFGIYLALCGAVGMGWSRRGKMLAALLLLLIAMPIKLWYSYAASPDVPILRGLMVPAFLVLVWCGYDIVRERCVGGGHLLDHIPDPVLGATFFVFCTEGLCRHAVVQCLFQPLGLSGFSSCIPGLILVAALAFALSISVAMVMRSLTPRLYCFLMGGNRG